MATGVAKHGGSIPTDFMQELQRRRDVFRANNPGTLSNWAGCTLEDRARAVGRMMFYDMPYRDQCNASHSGPGTLEYALVDEDGERRAHFGPVVHEAHPVVVVTTGMLMLIADIVDSCGIDRAFGHRSHALSQQLQTFGADHDPRRARNTGDT